MGRGEQGTEIQASEKMAIYSENMKIFTEDGTEIDDDDYLMDLPNQSLLVVCFQGAEKPKACPPEDIFHNLLTNLRWGGGVRSVYEEVLCFMQKDFNEKWQQMMK